MVNPDRNLYEPPYDDALLYDAEAEPDRPRSQSLVVMLGFVVVAAFAGVVWVAYNYGVSEGRRDQNPPVLYGEQGPDKVPGEQQLAEAPTDPVGVAPDKSYDELWEDDAPPAGTASTDPEAGVDRPEMLIEEPPVLGGQGGEYKPAPVDPRMDPTLDLHDDARPRALAPRSLPAPPVVEAVSPPAAVDAPASRPAAPALTTPPAATVKPAASAPKPIARPEPAPAAIAPAPAIADAPVAPVSSGVSIQLGAFPSSDAAAAHWTRVKGQNQELLSDYSPRFIPVDIPGKGTLYRLRVTGFADKSAAKSVCDQIIAGGGACILAGK